jgi:hypothetical protein
MTFYRVTATESGASIIVPLTRGWTSLAAGCCIVLGLTPAELADRVLLPANPRVAPAGRGTRSEKFREVRDACRRGGGGDYRGLDRVRLHADLTILAKLTTRLATERALPLAA